MNGYTPATTASGKISVAAMTDAVAYRGHAVRTSRA